MDEPTELTDATNAVPETLWGVAQEATPARHDDERYLRIKRLIDAAGSFAALLLLSPLLLVVALLIKLDSEGPVFFVQERVGYDPRTQRQTTFRMFKFRSMRYRADESLHRAHVSNLIRQNSVPSEEGSSLKLAKDGRITRVGRLLRKTSLDELPQLINVMRGEMSLVGPRPALQ